MALETLSNVNSIDGFSVIREKERDMSWDSFDDLRKKNPILITDRLNMISFRIQNGPIKEVGVNGCQVDTLIEAAKLIIEGLNKNFPCEENRAVIFHLDQALVGLDFRRSNRVIRGVEGKNQL